MKEKISIIAPVYNERENLEFFVKSICQALDPTGEEYEVILIDDGSTDGSDAILSALPGRDPRIKVIQFRRNFGQTAAMAAGFDYASGDIFVPMDADLQNDPQDIPQVLAKLREGYDVVSCWRQKRKDPWLTRRFPSQLANTLISYISGVHLHDYGCTLKGYRREVVKHIRLYGEMHRFIPVYASWAGAKVAEIPVRHHARRAGSSKYGLGRTFKVILDLITVKMLGSYSTKPMYFFGGVGLLACAVGFIFGLWTLYDKFVDGVKAHNNPFLLLAVFLFLLGVQFVLMGLVAELVIRTYFESQGKVPYIVRQILTAEKSIPDSPPSAGSIHN
ncbi:MAG TPA: glycosyltransferase family 2 protein [Acidobacteriota bacterium]|nr:glycosyltransferase family 2 protein [Acidobacteriota bacterium]